MGAAALVQGWRAAAVLAFAAAAVLSPAPAAAAAGIEAWPGPGEVQPVDGAGAFAHGLTGVDVEPGGTTAWAVSDSDDELVHLRLGGTTWRADRTVPVHVDRSARLQGVAVVEEDVFAIASGGRRSETVRVHRGTGTVTGHWSMSAGDATGITQLPDGTFAVSFRSGQIGTYRFDGDGGIAPSIMTFPSGFDRAADVRFDRPHERLWVLCDEPCEGRTNVLDARFEVVHRYDRPPGLPKARIAGLAFAGSSCAGGVEDVVWADAIHHQGHALLAGTMLCSSDTTQVPELPPWGAPTAIGGAGLAGVTALRRRRRRS